MFSEQEYIKIIKCIRGGELTTFAFLVIQKVFSNLKIENFKGNNAYETSQLYADSIFERIPSFKEELEKRPDEELKLVIKGLYNTMEKVILLP